MTNPNVRAFTNQEKDTLSVNGYFDNGKAHVATKYSIHKSTGHRTVTTSGPLDIQERSSGLDGVMCIAGVNRADSKQATFHCGSLLSALGGAQMRQDNQIHLPYMVKEGRMYDLGPLTGEQAGQLLLKTLRVAGVGEFDLSLRLRELSYAPTTVVNNGVHAAWHEVVTAAQKELNQTNLLVRAVRRLVGAM